MFTEIFKVKTFWRRQNGLYGVYNRAEKKWHTLRMFNGLVSGRKSGENAYITNVSKQISNFEYTEEIVDSIRYELCPNKVVKIRVTIMRVAMIDFIGPIFDIGGNRTVQFTFNGAKKISYVSVYSDKGSYVYRISTKDYVPKHDPSVDINIELNIPTDVWDKIVKHLGIRRPMITVSMRNLAKQMDRGYGMSAKGVDSFVEALLPMGVSENTVRGIFSGSVSGQFASLVVPLFEYIKPKTEILKDILDFYVLITGNSIDKAIVIIKNYYKRNNVYTTGLRDTMSMYLELQWRECPTKRFQLKRAEALHSIYASTVAFLRAEEERYEYSIGIQDKELDGYKVRWIRDSVELVELAGEYHNCVANYDSAIRINRSAIAELTYKGEPVACCEYSKGDWIQVYGDHNSPVANKHLKALSRMEFEYKKEGELA